MLVGRGAQEPENSMLVGGGAPKSQKHMQKSGGQNALVRRGSPRGTWLREIAERRVWIAGERREKRNGAQKTIRSSRLGSIAHNENDDRHVSAHAGWPGRPVA